MSAMKSFKPKHWLIPNDLRDTPYDEANQNNWAWPESRMKKNARASYRVRLVTTVGILAAGLLIMAGFVARAFGA